MATPPTWSGPETTHHPSIDGPDGIWPQVRGPVDDPAEARRLNIRVGHDLGGWWPQERITHEQVDDAIRAVDESDRGGGVDVMITHDVPAGVDMGGDDDWSLGVAQRRLIRRVVDHGAPEVLICGHWHRFRQQRIATDQPGGTDVVALSADVNRDEPQYCWLRIAPGGSVELDVPSPWRPDEDSLPLRRRRR